MDYQRPHTTPETYSTTYVDAGLQAFMQKVYSTMAIGLVITGLAAFAVSTQESVMQLLFATPLKWAMVFAPLAYLLFGFSPGRLMRMGSETVKMHFMIFSGLMGLSMSVLLLAYTGESIARAFFITAGTFAAMSIYGYTTKRNLTNLGAFLIMGMIGIFIAAIVNIFIESSMMSFVISILGVIIFTGLTAYDTQNLKRTYAEGNGYEANNKLAYVGALSLYLNFINLFQFILSLIGNRE